MMEALQEALAQIKAQNDTLATLKAQNDKLTTRQEELDKQLQKAVYPAGADPNKVYAEVKDPTEEGRFAHIKSFGHFLTEVRQSPNRMTPSPTLQKAFGWAVEKAIVGANETTGSDGGFLVPPEFSKKIFARLYKDSALFGKCDNYTVVGNSMTFPRSSESSRVNGSRYGGIVSEWKAEGAAGTLSKPGFGILTLKLHKLMSLGAITSELSEDQSVMPQYMIRAFGDETNFMINDAIVRGTGAGQPTGLLTTPSRVTVSKESGQLAATIVTANIIKIYSRLWAGSRENAVWLTNQDTFPQLSLLSVGLGTAGALVYMPPGGLSGKPYATLYGAPVFEIEQASTLGTEGDLILVDLSQYVTISKGMNTPQQTAQSIHVYFDTDQVAFRLTTRVDGQPWMHAPITPYKGTATQSFCVTLETRA